VLCTHPTDNIDGHKVVVGLSAKENRSYASELAERGFVTLAPAYPHLASYQPDWEGLGYVSGSIPNCTSGHFVFFRTPFRSVL
jgi:hypothetical protein